MHKYRYKKGLQDFIKFFKLFQFFFELKKNNRDL